MGSGTSYSTTSGDYTTCCCCCCGWLGRCLAVGLKYGCESPFIGECTVAGGWSGGGRHSPPPARVVADVPAYLEALGRPQLARAVHVRLLQYCDTQLPLLRVLLLLLLFVALHTTRGAPRRSRAAQLIHAALPCSAPTPDTRTFEFPTSLSIDLNSLVQQRLRLLLLLLFVFVLLGFWGCRWKPERSRAVIGAE